MRLSGTCAVRSRHGQASTEIAPGLRRWSARHEEWHEDVGSLAVDRRRARADRSDRAAGAAREARARAADRLLARPRRPARCGAVWASTRSVRALRSRGIAVTDAFRAGDELPGGIRAFADAARVRGRLLASGAPCARRRRRPARSRREAGATGDAAAPLSGAVARRRDARRPARAAGPLLESRSSACSSRTASPCSRRRRRAALAGAGAWHEERWRCGAECTANQASAPAPVAATRRCPREPAFRALGSAGSSVAGPVLGTVRIRGLPNSGECA